MAKKNYPKNYIKEVRKIKGFTAQQLAEATNTTAPYISMLENGNRRLYQDWVTKIATALECHPSDITEGPGQLMAARDEKEKDLLSTFRGLDDSAKQMYLHTLKSFSTVEEPETAEPDDAKDDKKNVR